MRRVSVHIVTYNNESTISRCIRALKAQRYKRWKLLVVDNASTDKTVSIVKRLGFPVITNDRNVGYAAAHNQAIALTAGDYVLTLNPDVALDSGFLSEMVAAMEVTANRRVGSAAGLLFRVADLTDSARVIDGAGLFMRRNRRQGLRHELEPMDKAEREPAFIFGPDGAAAFYKRAMLRDIHIRGEYFDEDFFMHKEDVDVCWRAQLAGWTSIFVPRATARHIRSFRAGQRKGIPGSLKMMAIRNRYFLMIKNETLSLFLRDVVPILLYDLGICLYVLFRERTSLKAYGEVVRSLPSMVRKRRAIQSRKKVTDAYMGTWFT